MTLEDREEEIGLSAMKSACKTIFSLALTVNDMSREGNVSMFIVVQSGEVALAFWVH